MKPILIGAIIGLIVGLVASAPLIILTYRMLKGTI